MGAGQQDRAAVADGRGLSRVETELGKSAEADGDGAKQDVAIIGFEARQRQRIAEGADGGTSERRDMAT